jgi:hypothetical protein
MPNSIVQQIMQSKPPSLIWTNWLLVVSMGVMAFGLILVLAPALAMQGFSLLVYAEPARIASFGTEPARYIALSHAVLGSIMVGWGAALVMVTRALFAKGAPTGWSIIAFSVGAWVVPDTAYSLLSGFWQNAILNVIFLILFAIPLIATRKGFHANR